MNKIEIYTKNKKEILSYSSEEIPEEIKFLESIISDNDFEHLFYQLKNKIIKITKIFSSKVDEILETDNVDIEKYFPSDIGESGA